jgi:DNA-binding NtrC family response regulator
MFRKILIVDDEDLILSGLSKCLADDNTDIKTVSTGADALKEIGSCPYDLCFLDVFLPDVNGIEVLKKIKTLSPATKVVIMTAHDVSDDMSKDIKDNSFNFIGKPFDLSQVRAITELALGRDGTLRGSSVAFKPESKEERQFSRKSLTQSIDYFAGVFEDGELKVLTLKGEIIDISQGGIGIKTDYNLNPGYMIRFSSELIPQAVGLVKWSMSFEESFRVGIEFVRRA